MLLRVFKGNSPVIIVLIAIAFLAIWISAFLHPPALAHSTLNPDTMPLYGLLEKVTGNEGLIGVTASFAMVVIMAFLIVNFNTASFFINERTYLPAFLYILAGGFFPESRSLNPALPASLFLMTAIIRIVDGYRKPGIANNFFDAGILISTGSLFYANLIWFSILILVGIVIIRTVNFTEIIIALLGLITPYFITAGVLYVSGKDPLELLSLMGENLFTRSEGYIFSRLTIVSLIFAAIITTVSMVFLIKLLNTKKIKSRKIFALLIWTFLISIIVYILLPSMSVEIVWITAIPFSYFLTHYFLFMKKRLIPEIFFSVFILSIILIQIWYLL